MESTGLMAGISILLSIVFGVFAIIFVVVVVAGLNWHKISNAIYDYEYDRELPKRKARGESVAEVWYV